MKKLPVRTFELSDEAMKHLRYFSVYAQRIIYDHMVAQLIESDPEEQTAHKKPLKRTIPGADWYLIIERWRSLYRVETSAGRTHSRVAVIGEKINNKLYVKGKEYIQWRSGA